MAFFWYLALAVVLLISAIYFTLFFKKIQVNNINIAGNVQIATNDIKKLVNLDSEIRLIDLFGWKVSTKSMLLVNTGAISQHILAEYPKIGSAQVKKSWPETISVLVKERTPTAVFCAFLSEISGEKCFLMDASGIIYEEIYDIPADMAIVRQDLSKSDISTGENVVNSKVIAFISEIDKNLKSNFDIDVMDALVTNPLRLNIQTSEDWQIYFNLEADASAQITRMNSLLNDEIAPEQRRGLQYIDLRFKDRAYYK